MSPEQLIERVHDEHLCLLDYLSSRTSESPPDPGTEARAADYSVGVAMIRTSFPESFARWQGREGPGMSWQNAGNASAIH